MADGGDVVAGPWPIEHEAPPPKPSSPAAQILAKASELIDGERDRQHGDRKVCHTQIARLWSAFLGVQITPIDAALMLALLKVARMQTGNPNRDNFVDACGYISIAGEMADVSSA